MFLIFEKFRIINKLSNVNLSPNKFRVTRLTKNAINCWRSKHAEDTKL